MNEHISHLLVGYVLGELTNEVRFEAQLHLAICLECADECEDVKDMIGFLATFPKPQRPPDGVRSKLMAQCSGGNRFHSFVERVASMLAVSSARASELFELLDHSSLWQPGPSEGSLLLPVPDGRKSAFTGFIRLEPDTLFPSHQHFGNEHLLVLSGGYTDHLGHEYHPGEDDIHEADSSHAITAMSWVPCICALVIEDGFKFIPEDQLHFA